MRYAPEAFKLPGRIVEKMRETGRLGARDLCAGRSPPGAVLARPAIRDFPAAIAAGRGQAAAAPLFAPHKGRVGDPPLMLSPPVGGASVSGARRCVLW